MEDMVGVGAGDLVESSMLLDLPGLRGTAKEGKAECLALFKEGTGSAGGAGLEKLLDALESAAPAGMAACSLRAPHAEGALFASYPSGMQPGYTHALCVDFTNAASLDAFVGSGALAAMYAPLVADKSIDGGPEAPPLVLGLTF